MRWMRLCLALVLVGSHRAPAQTTSPIEQNPKSAAQADLEKDMRGLAYLGEHDAAEVVSFTLRDGKIFPETRLPVADQAYLKIKGLGGWAKVRVMGRETIHSAGNE